MNSQAARLLHDSFETLLAGTPSGRSSTLLMAAPAAQAPVILLLDDSDLNRRMLRAVLASGGANFQLIEAKRPSEAFEIAAREKVDLVITEYVMPEMTGPEFCRQFRADKQTRLVPVLLLATVSGSDKEVAGFMSGADEFLLKPIHPQVLLARVQAMLRHKAAIDSLEEVESILFTLAQTVEQRDEHTGAHCQRLANLSVGIGLRLGLPREQLLALYRGGYLHDIGKIAVPDSILFKKGSLTAEEWVVMRSHTTRGEEICKPMKSMKLVLPIIRNHHEKWDGSGYPDGLAGEAIPLLARILQIADIYDALTSERPYKPALTHGEAMAMLHAETQRGWRDPEVVRALHEVFKNPPAEMADYFRIESRMSDSLAALKRELV
jgi:putative two-component system response regulator